MKTFIWKKWRFAWLVHPNWGWSTTVYDIDGKWVKVFGNLSFLTKKGHDHYDC
jgi:hypothetical protein